jgi:tripartite-type tricarboxylate transporter receptor subunit TctC
MFGHLREGHIRGLAVLRDQRLASLPDVPTMIESGVKGVDGSSWSGVLAPAGTKQEIIDLVRGQILAALRSAEFQDKLKKMGAEERAMSAAEFGSFIGTEATRIAAIMKAAGLKAQ